MSSNLDSFSSEHLCLSGDSMRKAERSRELLRLELSTSGAGDVVARPWCGILGPRDAESPRLGELIETSRNGETTCRLSRGPGVAPSAPRGVGGRMEPSLVVVFRLLHGSLLSPGVGGRIEPWRS